MTKLSSNLKNYNSFVKQLRSTTKYNLATRKKKEYMERNVWYTKCENLGNLEFQETLEMKSIIQHS